MWDLDTLRYLNEQAHQRAVARINELSGEASQIAGDRIFPLSDIARRLLTGPPSLANLADLLQNSDIVAEFRELVRTYVPEHEADIMSQEDEARIREFARWFGQRYFPLSDEINLDDFTFGDLLRVIPVDLMGFSYEDYHMFQDFRPGFVLLLSLVGIPWGDDDEGGRVPLLEEVQQLVGGQLVELIPTEGWEPADLHRTLDGTKYAGAALFADWVYGNTGFWQLDATYDGYEGEPWDPEAVEILTRQWPRVVDIQNKIAAMYNMLEEDTYYHFKNILYAITDRKDLIIPKEQLALPLFENE